MKTRHATFTGPGRPFGDSRRSLRGRTEHPPLFRACGVSIVEGASLGFRHELARQAVEDTLSPARRRMLHAQVLRAFIDLGERQAPLPPLVHHPPPPENAPPLLPLTPPPPPPPP